MLLLMFSPTDEKTPCKFLDAARPGAQESPRYIALGTDCSPGSDVVNVVQVQSLIVILKQRTLK